ncbi:hypothetical protein NDU88_001098 [Pleurodeles waltl]|uniref:Uncharacterized protein n=1 Tax=Pleurodeles waltl TaxID=8319 RepID=A0AAV7SYA8_PLEWA|nr:hypothetical protein NDU88_001098 [Pleurodeles waltl]
MGFRPMILTGAIPAPHSRTRLPTQLPGLRHQQCPGLPCRHIALSRFPPESPRCQASRAPLLHPAGAPPPVQPPRLLPDTWRVAPPFSRHDSSPGPPAIPSTPARPYNGGTRSGRTLPNAGSPGLTVRCSCCLGSSAGPLRSASMPQARRPHALTLNAPRLVHQSHSSSP